jgi:opacity protein-like surface antigen
MRLFFRTSTFCTALMGLSLGLPAVAAAQAVASTQSVTEPNTITITPFLSGSFGTSQDLGGSLGFGGAVGYDLTKNLGFEGEFGHVFDVAGDDDNIDWSLTNFSGSVLYHFDVPRVTPYGAFGLGWERSNPDIKVPDPLALTIPSSTELAWHIGGGVKVPVTERFLARADLRRFQANDLAPDYWRLYGGLTFWVKR